MEAFTGRSISQLRSTSIWSLPLTRNSSRSSISRAMSKVTDLDRRHKEFVGSLMFDQRANDRQRKLKCNIALLDPFCGCGTTIDAAEKFGRDWIGIDVTQLAIS